MKSWKRLAAFFLAGQTLSLFGSSLVQYAMLWHLTLTTRSGVVMTGYVLAGFVPAILLAPFAGVWADRFDRKKLIVLADGAIALVSLLAAFLLSLGVAELPLFLSVAVLRSFGQAVHQPAVGAFLPRIVPQEKLTRVNGIYGTLQSALTLASPIVAAGLLSLIPIAHIFFIDVITAAAAIAFLVLFVRVNALPLATQPETSAAASDAASEAVPVPAAKTYFTDIMDGIRYVRKHRYLMSFYLYMGLLFFLVSPAAFLTMIQTARSFGEDVWRLTAIEIAFSIGMMGGGALIAVWGGFRNRLNTILVGNAIMGVCTLGLAFSPFLHSSLSFIIYLAFMGVFGVAIPLLNTPSTVLLQEHVEDAYLGRAFSLFMVISNSFMPLAMLLFGPLADIVSVELILAVTGALLLLIMIPVRANRRLMDAGIPVQKETAATELAS